MARLCCILGESIRQGCSFSLDADLRHFWWHIFQFVLPSAILYIPALLVVLMPVYVRPEDECDDTNCQSLSTRSALPLLTFHSCMYRPRQYATCQQGLHAMSVRSHRDIRDLKYGRNRFLRWTRLHYTLPSTVNCGAVPLKPTRPLFPFKRAKNNQTKYTKNAIAEITYFP
jgi:hypothetical protein